MEREAPEIPLAGRDLPDRVLAAGGSVGGVLVNDLERAATILEEYADLLADTHMVNGSWPIDLDEYAHQARMSCAEYRALANKLRKS